MSRKKRGGPLRQLVDTLGESNVRKAADGLGERVLPSPGPALPSPDPAPPPRHYPATEVRPLADSIRDAVREAVREGATPSEQSSRRPSKTEAPKLKRGRRRAVTDVTDDAPLLEAAQEMRARQQRITRDTLAATAGVTPAALRGWLHVTRRTFGELLDGVPRRDQ